MTAQPKGSRIFKFPKTALLFCTLALAGCTGLPSTVESLLTAEDRALIERVTQESLESSQIGESKNWRNDESEHGGNVTPLRTFTGSADRPCRDFQQTVAIDGRTTIAYDSACRQIDGSWASLNYANLSDAIASTELNGSGTYGQSYPDYYRPLPYYYGPYYGFHSQRYSHRYRPYRYRHRPHYGFRFGYGHHYGYPYPLRRYHY